MSVQPSSTNLGEEIYSGAAGYGKISAIISAIIATFISICMVIGGIYVIKNRSKMKSVDGDINGNSDCKVITSNNNVSTVCSTFVTYTVNGTVYDKILTQTGSTSYIDKQKVIIWYNPETPNKPDMEPTGVGVGYLIIILAIIICIGAWAWVYITRISKFAAAASGVSDVLNMFKR